MMFRNLYIYIFFYVKIFTFDDKRNEKEQPIRTNKIKVSNSAYAVSQSVW